MKNFFTPRKFILALALLPMLGIHAQWSTDYATNNRITPSSIAFYDPVVETNAQGTTYIFFQVPNTENGEEHRQMRLQIVDADGNRVFGAAGKTISKELNITWTKYNQSMILDRDGNAIIAIYDQRNADERNEEGTLCNFNQSLYKFSPAGEQLWGPVQLNGGKANDRLDQLYMTTTADNSIYAVYTYKEDGGRSSCVKMEKINPDGTLAWDTPVDVEPSESTSYPYIADNGNNQVMVFYMDNDYEARIFDADGNDVLGKAVTAYTGGFADSHIYEVSTVKPVAAGGAMFIACDPGYLGRFVYIKKDGSYAFSTEAEGTQVPGESFLSTVPDVTYNPADSSFYSAYVNVNPNGIFAGYGLSAQKFDSIGNKQWDGNGLTIVPTSGTQQLSSPKVRVAGNGEMAVFYQYMASTGTSDPVGSYMTILDKEGNVVSEPMNFSTSQYVKNNFSVSDLINNDHFIGSWTEKRASASNESVYLQKVDYTPSTTGISQIARNNGEVKSVEYFTISGAKVEHPSDGIYIVRKTYTNNTVSTDKVVFDK